MAQVLKMDEEDDEAPMTEAGAGGGKGKDDNEDAEEEPPPSLAGSTADTPSASRGSAPLAGSDLAEATMGAEASVAVGSAGILGGPGELAKELASFRALLQVYPKGWMPRDLADMVQRRQSAFLGHVR